MTEDPIKVLPAIVSCVQTLVFCSMAHVLHKKITAYYYIGTVAQGDKWSWRVEYNISWVLLFVTLFPCLDVHHPHEAKVGPPSIWNIYRRMNIGSLRQHIESTPPPLLSSEASLPRFDPRIMNLECWEECVGPRDASTIQGCGAWFHCPNDIPTLPRLDTLLALFVRVLPLFVHISQTKCPHSKLQHLGKLDRYPRASNSRWTRTPCSSRGSNCPHLGWVILAVWIPAHCVRVKSYIRQFSLYGLTTSELSYPGWHYSCAHLSVLVRFCWVLETVFATLYYKPKQL